MGGWGSYFRSRSSDWWVGGDRVFISGVLMGGRVGGDRVFIPGALRGGWVGIVFSFPEL